MYTGGPGGAAQGSPSARPAAGCRGRPGECRLPHITLLPQAATHPRTHKCLQAACIGSVYPSRCKARPLNTAFHAQPASPAAV